MLPLELGGRLSRASWLLKRKSKFESAKLQSRTLACGEIRVKFGEALAQAMKLSFTDELVEANQQSFNLIAAKVMEGATPPLEQNMASSNSID